MGTDPVGHRTGGERRFREGGRQQTGAPLTGSTSEESRHRPREAAPSRRPEGRELTFAGAGYYERVTRWRGRRQLTLVPRLDMTACNDGARDHSPGRCAAAVARGLCHVPRHVGAEVGAAEGVEQSLPGPAFHRGWTGGRSWRVGTVGSAKHSLERRDAGHSFDEDPSRYPRARGSRSLPGSKAARSEAPRPSSALRLPRGGSSRGRQSWGTRSAARGRPHGRDTSRMLAQVVRRRSSPPSTARPARFSTTASRPR